MRRKLAPTITIGSSVWIILVLRQKFHLSCRNKRLHCQDRSGVSTAKKVLEWNGYTLVYRLNPYTDTNLLIVLQLNR